MSSPKNLEYKKTSFLSKSNSSFIEEMYIKYIEKDPSLQARWENYFNTLNEDLNLITKENEGPNWKKNKKKITFDKKKITSKKNIENTENIEKYKEKWLDAVKKYYTEILPAQEAAKLEMDAVNEDKKTD